MANPAELHAGVVAHLRTLGNLSVYDGEVPDAPPADPGTGHVYPYVVVWPSAGWTPAEARTVDGDGHGALEWPVQVTVAAGEPGWCLEAVHAVRAALDGLEPAVGAGPLREEPGGPTVRPDRDATPVRFFVPLLFRSLNT